MTTAIPTRQHDFRFPSTAILAIVAGAIFIALGFAAFQLFSTEDAPAGSAPGTAPIPHDGGLPDPGRTQIILYMQRQEEELSTQLRSLIRNAYMSEWHPKESLSLTA